MKKKFSIILATDSKKGIWKKWDLAWSIPEDMKYFKDVTTKNNCVTSINAVIMWRKTWESIPKKYRPLPWRLNIILTSDTSYKIEWAIVKHSIEDCLNHVNTDIAINKIFIIWWATLYNQVLDNPSLEYIYLTKVKSNFKCDVFFKWIPKQFQLENKWEELKSQGNINYQFMVYKRK